MGFSGRSRRFDAVRLDLDKVIALSGRPLPFEDVLRAFKMMCLQKIVVGLNKGALSKSEN
jgi:hypothetical protein